MRRSFGWISVLLAAGCNDYGVTKHNALPSAQIVAPADGEKQIAGVPFDLLGHGSDPDGRGETFDATWRVDNEVVCGPLPTDRYGASRCTVTLAEGPHDIELVVRDGAGGVGADFVSIEAVGDLPPEIEILSPLPSGRYYADAPILFEVEVSDDHDLGEISVVWEEGEPLDLSPSLEGDRFVAEGALPEGLHSLVARAIDAAGGQGSDTVDVIVGPANRAPTCGVLLPADGGSSPIGAAVTLSGWVADEDQPAGELSVEWSSDIDGVLASSVADSDGSVQAEVALSAGPHQLSLRVEDERGAICTASISHSLGAPPEILLLSPSEGEIFPEGAVVSMSAQVSDAEDPATALLVSWSTDRDGLLAEGAPDATGSASFVASGLSRGLHVSTAAVADSDGASAEVVTTFTVDGLPSAPVVTITPNDPLTVDDLTASVDEESVDPDGDAIVYRYVWLKNGLFTAFTGPVLPGAETSAGDVWTVQVYPADPWFEGPPGTAERTIGDSPPAISAISLVPEPVYTQDTLGCSVSAVDPDGDPVTVTYSWSVDATTLPFTGASLSGSQFSRDQTVSCTATPSDGSLVGPSETASILVGNSPPSAPSLSISPSAPLPDDSLWCSVTTPSTDADTDTVSYSFRWSRNGTPYAGPTQSVVFAGDTIPASATATGDAWICLVTPSDGTDNGPVAVASTGISCAASTWFRDSDGDGYGLTSSAIAECVSPGAGWVLVGGDCEDGDSAIHPAAVEWCDDIDNDCDRSINEPQAADAEPWYRDLDGDGHGDPDDSLPGCEAPLGYVASPTDCDDSDLLVHPKAGDIAFDGIDGDCDGIDCEAAWQGALYLALCFGPSGWHDARLSCLLSGYDDLASVRSASEQSAIEGLLSSSGASASHSPWIGYADEVIEGLWGWSDLSSAVYSRWGPGEPNGGVAESCAELNWPLGSGLWNDAGCYDTSSRRAWVCEDR